MRYVRAIEIVLGAVFIFSAVTKALDIYQFAVQVSYYGVVKEPSLVRLVAYLMVGLETALGACLLAGVRLRGVTLIGTTALLLAFSGLVLYAWQYRGLQECGCFGKYVQVGPKSTLAKNVVLIAFAIAAWVGVRRKSKSAETSEPESTSKWQPGYLLGTLGVLAVVLAVAMGKAPPPKTSTLTTSKSNAPFAKFVFTTDTGEEIDLGSGDYFVAMLSATCEHCQAAGVLLNDLMFMPDVPTTVGLLIADDPSAIDEFNAIVQPVFITHVIDALEWSYLIDKEPPRFYVIRDGVPLRHLDALDPTLDELYEFATEPDEVPATAAN